MSFELFSQQQDNESKKLAGLNKLKSAKKKAEIIGSLRTSSISSERVPSERAESQTDLSPNQSLAEFSDRYVAECKACGLAPHRTILRQIGREAATADFSNCVLGTAGAIPLIKALKGATEITHLKLNACGLDDSAVLLLVSLIATMPNLATIDLSDNFEIRHGSGFALQRIAQLTPSIQRITLTGTNVRASTIRSIHALCQRKAEYPNVLYL